MNKNLLASVALLAAAACGHAKMLSTSLAWSPSDDLGDLHQVLGSATYGWGEKTDVNGPDMSSQVMDAFNGQQLQLMAITDARTQQRDQIGSNIQDSTPRPVTTKDDVGQFVNQHLPDVFKACHVNVVPAGGTRILKGELLEYFAKEENRYNASAVFRFTLTDAKGTELWSGTADGKQDKWGRSFNADNYNEALSDALVRAVHNLLTNQQFLTAVHKGKA